MHITFIEQIGEGNVLHMYLIETNVKGYNQMHVHIVSVTCTVITRTYTVYMYTHILNNIAYYIKKWLVEMMKYFMTYWNRKS